MATEPDAKRCLQWEACYNARDLGGHRTAYGPETRYRAIVRSDNLSRLTPVGWAAMLDYGVRTIIDLRTPREVARELSPFCRMPHSTRVTYLNPPFYRDALTEAVSGTAPLEVDYVLMLADSRKRRIAAIMTAIARAPEGGVLFYCHSGKDRTGLVAALLLAVAGVPTEEIVADYALSAESLQTLKDDWLEHGPGERSVREQMAVKFTSRPETMLAVLEYLEREYEGVEQYLLGSGVTEADMRLLRARLRE